MNLDILKNTIQSCNINFLIGSGLSRDYLITLGNIESLLEELESAECEESIKNIIRASLFKKYFEEVMIKNVDIFHSCNTYVKIILCVIKIRYCWLEYWI